MMIGEFTGRQKSVGVPAWLGRADDIQRTNQSQRFSLI